MSEDLENDGNVKEEVTTEDVDGNTEETVEYSAVEQEAMERGWNPDKEAMPEGKEWISAGEFMRNSTFYTEINKLKRENKNIQKSFDVLTEHHRKVDEHAKKEALKQLKAEKLEALDNEDHAAVIEIDEKIDEVKATKTDPVDTQEVDNTAFNAFAERNAWYESNEEMRQIADDIGNGFYNRNEGKVSAEQIFKHVEKQIKGLYPDQFKPASNRQTVAAVESGNGNRPASKGAKSKFTAKDLTPEQRRVMKRFASTGVLTEAEYIKELVSIGELS